MKTQKRSSPRRLFEIVIPFDEEHPTELYEDCPCCRELEKLIESGEVEPISISEVTDAEGGLSARRIGTKSNDVD